MADALPYDAMVTEGPEYDPNQERGPRRASRNPAEEADLADSIRRMVDKARGHTQQFRWNATENKRYRLYGDPVLEVQDGNSRVSANLINDVLRKMAAVATDSRPTAEVMADHPEDAQAALVMGDILDYLWEKNESDAMVPLIHMDRWTAGCAVLRVGYNPFADGGQGEEEDELVDVRRMTWDTGCELMRNIKRDAQWVAEEAWPSKDWLKQVYPDRAAEIDDIGSSKPDYGKSGRSSSSPGEGAIVPDWSESTKNDARTGPSDDDGAAETLASDSSTVRVIDYWQRPSLNGGMGRHIIVADDLVLEDDFNPYWDRDTHAFPYVFSPTDEEPGEEGPVALVSLLWPLHRQICDMLRMMADHAMSEAHDHGFYERDSVSAEELNSGVRWIPLDSMTGQNLPQRVQALGLSESFIGAFNIMLKEFYDVAGVQDSARGVATGETNAAAAIRQLQEIFKEGVRLDVRAVERMSNEAGNMRISRVEQFWTMEKTIPVVGQQGAGMFLTVYPHIVHDPMTDEVLAVASPFFDTKGFRYKVKTGSSMPPDQEKTIQLALVGRQMGDISPQQLWSYTPFKFDGPNATGGIPPGGAPPLTPGASAGNSVPQSGAAPPPAGNPIMSTVMNRVAGAGQPAPILQP